MSPVVDAGGLSTAHVSMAAWAVSLAGKITQDGGLRDVLLLTC